MGHVTMATESAQKKLFWLFAIPASSFHSLAANMEFEDVMLILHMCLFSSIPYPFFLFPPKDPTMLFHKKAGKRENFLFQ